MFNIFIGNLLSWTEHILIKSMNGIKLGAVDILEDKTAIKRDLKKVKNEPTGISSSSAKTHAKSCTWVRISPCNNTG